MTDKNEQLAIIHARRTSSAEHEFFSTGKRAFSIYIEGEEFNEEVAKETIREYREERKQKRECEQNGKSYCDDSDHDDDDSDHDDDAHDGCFPRRIATSTRYYSQQSDVVDTIATTCHRAPPPGSRVHKKSLLRTLCASISRSKHLMKEDITAQFKDIIRGRYHHEDNDAYDTDGTFYGGNVATDTFSSIPDDVYSVKRVRMMRQMSS